MPWLARLRSLGRNLLRRAAADRELDDEVRSVVDLLADEKAARGLPPDAARRAAKVELGGVEPLKARLRGARAGAWLPALGQDLRHGLRILRGNPGFAAVAVATLA